MYFLELADYCTRENNDEREVLKLLYQSLRALTVKSIPRRLVRCIYEIRLVVANGEFPVSYTHLDVYKRQFKIGRISAAPQKERCADRTAIQ